jgi:hypothetical protein
MDNQERFVKWKCPECGNYHKWVWDIYDIFGGEITMTCDNPECGRTSKMCMVPEKNGNATALVADNSQTEIDISKVLIEGDQVTIMGVKYKRVEEPKSPAEKAYYAVYGWYPPTTSSVSNYEDNRWRDFQNGYNASKVSETPQEPEELKTLYQMFYENDWNVRSCEVFCDIVKEWMSQYADNVMCGEYKKGYEYCLTVLEENLKND